MNTNTKIRFTCPEHGVEFAKKLEEGRNTIIVCYAPKTIKWQEVDIGGAVIEKERQSRCWFHLSGYNGRVKKTNVCADCEKEQRVPGSAYCKECKNRRYTEYRLKNNEKFIQYRKKYRAKMKGGK